MRHEATQQTYATEHVYKPTWRSISILAIWLMNALVFGIVRLFDRTIFWLMTWFGFDTAPSHFSLVESVGWVVVMATFFAWLMALHGVSLTLDHDGFAYRTRFGSNIGGWRDVERIGRVRSMNPCMIGAGLVLRAIPNQPRNPLRRLTWGYGGRFVPLAPFAADWRMGAIGDDIRRYAPQLLRDGDGSG